MKKKLFDLITSYGLACVLLAFLLLLTFLGTLEQTDHGLFEVQKKYFESLYLVHYIGPVPIPLPGVYLILLLLTVNLVAGGLVKIRKGKQTVGVIIIHLGMLLLFCAGFVKMKFSADGHLTLMPQQKSNDFQAYYDWEIAIYDASQATEVKELLITEDEFSNLTGDKTRTFEHPDLPFKLTLRDFERNSRVQPWGPVWAKGVPNVDGYGLKGIDLDKEAEANVAGCYVTVEEKVNGTKHEGILSGLSVYPFSVVSGGKTWAIDLRHKRYQMPFTITLDKFTRELYPRTQTAKVYMSDVTMTEEGRDQKIKIEMNSPLRHHGLILFQASFQEFPNGTFSSTFAVVKNPSDHWPLASCIVIAIGMLIAFVQKLTRYIVVQSTVRKA
jgi:hypothetical protein